MTNRTGGLIPPPATPRSVARKRHWWRWILASVVALLVILVAAVAAFIKLQPAPPPLALPTSSAAVPSGPPDGTWQVVTGSVAGFRLRETALGFSNDVVGRTGNVGGTIVISGGRVTAATLRVGLAAVKVGGKAQAQFAKSLGTGADPVATFTLARPVALGPAFASGATVRATAVGHLTMHGASRLVTVALSGRQDGQALQVAGTIPVMLVRWGIQAPPGYGFFGSLANQGVAEFLLMLRRS